MTLDECVYINLISGGSHHIHSLFIASVLYSGYDQGTKLAHISMLLGLLPVMSAASNE